MSLVPGQLTVRSGSKLISPSEDRALTLWGYSIGSGKTEKIIGFTETAKLVEFDQIGSGDGPSQISSTKFQANRPVNFSQGRRGEVYIYQGYGQRGMVRTMAGDYRFVGLDAPDEQPVITKSRTSSSYIARIDVIDAGNGYHAPPSITIASPGSGGRQGKAISRIAAGKVSEIELTDGGSGYTKTPCIEFSAPTGQTITGSGVDAKLSLKDGAAKGSPTTGVVFWEVIELPYFWWLCLSGLTKEGSGYIVNAVSKSGKGSGAKAIFFLSDPQRVNCFNPSSDGEDLTDLSALFQVYDFGEGYEPGDEITVTVKVAASYTSSVGAGTSNSGGPACTGGAAACQLVARGYVIDDPRCPDRLSVIEANPYKRRQIKTDIVSGGSGYLTPPTFVTDDGNTISTEINCEGKVIKLTLEEPNKTYLFPPQLLDLNGNVGKAYALAIMRPIFRGKYQCYYRYVDESVPESEGGPIYSSLSPVTEVDCGDGCASITWAYEPLSGGQSWACNQSDPDEPEVCAPVDWPAANVNQTGSSAPNIAVELWRTTADQSTVLFRVAKIGGKDQFGSTLDTLSDYDLANPSRKGFLAMPIVLSDGSLNANRFGVASPDFAVGVVFQDRTWLAVDTTGKRPNTLMYSEADEPEAMPEVNELILQTNLRDTDYITALIPYAGALIVAQSRHCHRLSFVNSPAIDATTSLVAYRGCINQRCWDIYEGIAYMLDDAGLCSMDPQGRVEHLSSPIDSLFRVNPDPTLPTIDFLKREWFFVRADRNLGVIRVHVAFKGDLGNYPSRQIVFHPESKTFWREQYPASFSAATEVRDEAGSIVLIHGGDKGLYQFGVGLTDDAEPVTFAWKSSNFEFFTDRTKNGGQQNSRNVSVVYKPTKESTTLNMEVFYNGSATPRSNVVGRDRGVGFVHVEDKPLAFIDMKALPQQEAESHGIARALFAGKTLEDFSGSDTHVAIRLYGQQTDAGDVVIHSVDLQGVSAQGGGE
jgi:hypothetical protein